MKIGNHDKLNSDQLNGVSGGSNYLGDSYSKHFSGYVNRYDVEGYKGKNLYFVGGKHALASVWYYGTVINSYEKGTSCNSTRMHLIHVIANSDSSQYVGEDKEIDSTLYSAYQNKLD